MSIGNVTGLKALFAAQISLQTAGHNIANASVPGYARQNVLLTTDHPITITGLGFLGTGVRATGITRTVDELLEARLRTTNQGLGRLNKETSLLSQVEDLFSEPSDSGLASLMSKFFTTLNDLTLDPTDPTLRADVTMSGQVLTDGFNTLANKLSDFRQDLETELDGKVTRINQLAMEITELTGKITASTSAKMEANELLDQRTEKIKELSSLVATQVVDQGDGRLSVLIDGRILSTSGVTGEIEMSKDASGALYIHMVDVDEPLRIKDGEVKALLDQQQTVIPELQTRLDKMAKEFAFKFNRIHSVGLPSSGSFSFLKAEVRGHDLNLDGDPTNEVLSEAGLPYPPEAGSLYVTVTDINSGAVQQTIVEYDPDRDSLGSIASKLSAIPHLGAYADSQGRLTLHAAEGYTFDFAPNLDPAPDKAGTFGSRSAMLVASATYPVTLAAGDAFVIAEDGVNLPAVTFAGGSYTASQIAAEINNQTGKNLASVVDGQVVIESTSEGSTSTLQITNTAGSPAATLGLSTALETGADLKVNVALEGQFTGSTNSSWRFEASGSGTIGVTPNLTITVYDDTGTQIGVLDVGAGYSPGDMVELADGVKVSFTSGDVSASSGDFFSVDMIADPDTGGLLASLGLNTFFLGTSASDIKISEDIVETPGLISASLSPKEGDNANAVRLAGLENDPITGLGDNSVVNFYSSLIGKLGLDKQWSDDMYQAQELLMANLENQRASVSGVSIDEELLNLDKFQQMLDAATRYLTVINEVTESIMSLA
jgi:flagellar hook-associated protein 1 FlgK